MCVCRGGGGKEYLQCCITNPNLEVEPCVNHLFLFYTINVTSQPNCMINLWIYKRYRPFIYIYIYIYHGKKFIKVRVYMQSYFIIWAYLEYKIMEGW